MHKIDLNKYEVRTDMAVDLIHEKNRIKNYKEENVNVSWIKIDENNKLNKNPGTYITLEFDDVTDDNAKKCVSKVFSKELKCILDEAGYNKNMKTCVIGLGNIKSTPDSLGPKITDKIIVTNHFFDMNIDVDEKFSKVLSFYPGVTGQTGIETKDYIKGVIDIAKPDLVIVIDSLSSSSISRVNKSIQITDSGISPGSGVGNKRSEISKNTLGIPVIAIGVPTVASASVIVADTINYMMKNYTYNKSFLKSKSSKFVNKNVNYLNKDVDVSINDRKNLLGLVGMLSYDEVCNLACEVLTPIGYNLMVTPKEIDFVIDKFVDIISYGINNNLHNI